MYARFNKQHPVQIYMHIVRTVWGKFWSTVTLKDIESSCVKHFTINRFCLNCMRMWQIYFARVVWCDWKKKMSCPGHIAKTRNGGKHTRVNDTTWRCSCPQISCFFWQSKAINCSLSEVHARGRLQNLLLFEKSVSNMQKESRQNVRTPLPGTDGSSAVSGTLEHSSDGRLVDYSHHKNQLTPRQTWEKKTWCAFYVRPTAAFLISPLS